MNPISKTPPHFLAPLLALFFLSVLTGNAQLNLGQCYSTNSPVTTAEDTPVTFTLQTPLSVCASPVGPTILSGYSVGRGTVTTPNSFANPPTFTYTRSEEHTSELQSPV